MAIKRVIIMVISGRFPAVFRKIGILADFRKKQGRLSELVDNPCLKRQFCVNRLSPQARRNIVLSVAFAYPRQLRSNCGRRSPEQGFPCGWQRCLRSSGQRSLHLGHAIRTLVKLLHSPPKSNALKIGAKARINQPPSASCSPLLSNPLQRSRERLRDPTGIQENCGRNLKNDA